MTCRQVAGAVLCLLPWLAHGELQALDDATLSDMNGQGGVYLSGEFSINKEGGVLWSTPLSNVPAEWTTGQRSCATTGAVTAQACGVRVAIRSEAAGGWYVLDNLKGVFSFEGLTLRTRTIDSGFGGDGAGFDQDVLVLGLPNEVEFSEGSFAFGVANQGGWRNNALTTANGGDPGYQQTNVFSARIDGSIRMQGNVLIFPKN